MPTSLAMIYLNFVQRFRDCDIPSHILSHSLTPPPTSPPPPHFRPPPTKKNTTEQTEREPDTRQT